MRTNRSNIAIIGMACVFPGAHSPEELWENILAGRRAFRKLPDERLPLSFYFDSDPNKPGTSYSDQAALISDWSFDALKYRIAPLKMETSDLTHWLALDTAAKAMENSGLELDKENLTRAGCILGNSLAGEFARSHNLRLRSPYLRRVLTDFFKENLLFKNSIGSIVDNIENFYNTPFPPISEDTLAGNMSNTIVGRICNYFNLGGGGFTIDGACSSSLLAVIHAANALVSEELDIVLAGGVDISLDPFEMVGFAKTKALATDDIRVYDKKANGMLPGEGCGIIVLMREADAIRKGLKIKALLKGWGYSTDGRGNITAPNVEGQSRALNKAYLKAGYDISAIELLEGHGTGTSLGDSIELEAIQNIIEETNSFSQIGIGSIKGNIGHCKAAAGMAGLIKTVMALERKILPATVNCHRPHELFNQSLKPILKSRIWNTTKLPRRASVSAMGFGGSNAHVTLEEYDSNRKICTEDLKLTSSNQYSELVIFSGKELNDLKTYAESLIPIAKKISRAELVDLASHLCQKDEQEKFRIALLVDSPWSLFEKLMILKEQFHDGVSIENMDDPQNGIFAGEKKDKPRCIFLFPGQGSQHLNMGIDIIQRFPELLSLSKASDEPHLYDYFIKETLGEFKENIEDWEKKLKQTSIAQPSIVYTSLIYKMLLDNWNIQADAFIGHSLGELTAICSAGAITPETTVKVAQMRGEIMENIDIPDFGKMASIFAKSARVLELLSDIDGEIQIANYNGPEQTVVSGESTSIEKILKVCQFKGIQAIELNVSAAFHSKLVSSASESFQKILASVNFKEIKGSVISTSTGEELCQDVKLDQHLSAQISNPVKFLQAVKYAAEHFTPDLWIEVGPGNVLTNLVHKILPTNVVCYSTGEKGVDGFHALNKITARAYTFGFPVNTKRIFDNRFYREFDIVNYNPKFITNPCEKKIQPPRLNIEDELPSVDDFMPKNIEKDQWLNYLNQRKDFIKSFISLDLKHFSNNGANDHVGYPELLQKTTPKEEKPEEVDSSILNFALKWVAARTGFPLSTISPTMKLRDDLNLDSIKTTELALTIAEKLKITSIVNPHSFSNQTLSTLINTLETIALNQDDNLDVSKRQLEKKLNRNWIKTFPLSWIDAAIPMENVHQNWEGIKVTIFNQFHSNIGNSLEKSLQFLGVNPRIVSGNSLTKYHIDEDTKAIVYILPTLQNPFSQLNAEKYSQFFEEQAKNFFDFFQALLSLKPLNGLTILIASFYKAIEEQELLAPYAALKSFLLEHDQFFGKWVELHPNIPSQCYSQLIMNEIQANDGFTLIMYDHNMKRKVWGVDSLVPVLPVKVLKKDVFLEKNIVLVTGGGKGITFELAYAYAQANAGTTLVLVGTTSLNTNQDINTESELFKNLNKLKESKIRYFYYSCDITNLNAIRTLLNKVISEVGDITGILHGAGISKLNPIIAKEWAEFWQCIQVKALGLYNILSILPLGKLKFLHTISSIIGKTGMQGQFDYAYANAWLDGAVEHLRCRYPHIQIFSLGYSVWSGVGLGEKLGVIEHLNQVGINPIKPTEGINAYLNLTNQNWPHSNFITLGSLPQQLEKGLYKSRSNNSYRFIQKIVKWIPDTELVTEIEIGTDQDLYLLEHVFEGSVLFPGVMGIEAMLQVAKMLSGNQDLPNIENIHFHRPMIIMPKKNKTIRIEAFYETESLIKTQISEESNQQISIFFSADLNFQSLEKEIKVTKLPALTPLPINVEELHPNPLFQGKLFRRISSILKMEKGQESIAEVKIPSSVKYFSTEFTQGTISIPSVQDSFLQAGLLILPPQSLPSKIEKLVIYRLPIENEKVICKVKVKEFNQDKCVSSLWVYDANGHLIEYMKNVETLVPAYDQNKRKIIQKSQPTKISRLVSEFDALTIGMKIGIHVSRLAEDGFEGFDKLKIFEKPSPPARVECKIALSIAAQEAIIKLSDKIGVPSPSIDNIKICEAPSGQPSLKFLNNFNYNWHISMSDSDQLCLAAVGNIASGVDVEKIQARNAEEWMGLLGEFGYRIASELSVSLNERFDFSATRIWAMTEAVYKAQHIAFSEVRLKFESSLGGCWVSFSEAMGLEILSAIITDEIAGEETSYAFSFAFKNTKTLNLQ